MTGRLCLARCLSATAGGAFATTRRPGSRTWETFRQPPARRMEMKRWEPKAPCLNYAAIWSPGTGSGTVANLLSANGIAPSAYGFVGPVSISPDGSAMTAVIPNPISGEHYRHGHPHPDHPACALENGGGSAGQADLPQRLTRRRSLSRRERSFNMPISTRACLLSSSRGRTTPPHLC